MCVWRLVRLAIFLLVIVTTMVTAREYVDKRTADDRSWFLGSRYGRSGDRSRHVIVSPRRDDRFLTGSRYGKRTTGGDLPVVGHQQDNDRDMDCLYTGVSDLYRCIVSKEAESTGSFTTN